MTPRLSFEDVGMRSGDCVVTCYSVEEEEEEIKTLVDFTRLENLEPGSMRSLEMNGLMSRCEVTGGMYVQKNNDKYKVIFSLLLLFLI